MNSKAPIILIDLGVRFNPSLKRSAQVIVSLSAALLTVPSWHFKAGHRGSDKEFWTAAMEQKADGWPTLKLSAENIT
jgi:hypothetical protein